MSEENTEVTQTEEVSTEQVTQESTPVSFLDSISEDIRSEGSLQDFKSIDDLAKSYVHAQKTIGSSIRIPSEEAGKEQMDEFFRKLESVDGVTRLPTNDEEWSSFYNKLGRPESHDGYDLKIPEGMEVQEEALSQFTQLAHSLGLTNQQASKLAEYEAARQKQYHEASEQHFNATQKAGEETLRNQWGNDYENRLAGAKSMAKQYAEKFPEAMEALVSSDAGNNPAVLSMLSELYGYMKEDGVLTTSQTVNYGTSADEAKQKIADVQMNKDHAYWNSSDPGHAAATKMMEELFSAAYPS